MINKKQGFSIPMAPVGALSSRRAKRIRIAWYLLGFASGIALTISATQAFSYYSAQDTTLAAHHPASAPHISPMASVPMPAGLAELPALPAVDAAAAPVEAKKEIVYPLTLDLEVTKGDTLISMLTDTDVPYEEAYNVVQSIKKVYNPRRLNMGQSMAITLDKITNADSPVVTALAIPVSKIKTVQLTRKDDGEFAVEEIQQPVQKAVARSGGTINSSIYQTGLDSGVPAHLLAEVINAYSYDVDFQRDIQPGHHLDVLFEREQTEDGTVAGYGDIIYAELKMGDKNLRVYRYIGNDGVASYYNEKGESVKKALLRTPINGARISSGFGMRRHPILGYSKMHRGVDFAAITGTPIYAAGDGIVKMASPNGGYGNYLRIQHTDQYATAYGHLSRFAKGIRPGSKVKQGQVVAYVGTTGRSTGPHLHFEILAYGSQVNPSATKFKTGNTLSGKELAAFKENIRQVQTQLAKLSIGQTQVASASPQEEKKSAKN